MKTQLFIISLLIVSAFSGCSNADAQKKNVTEADIVKANREFIRWFNTGQLDSLSFLYLENPCMIPDNLPPIQSRKEISEYYRALFDQGFRFIEITPTAHVNGDQIMVERGTWKAVIHDNIELSGTYLSQWRYSNREWFIENEMTNVVASE